MAFVRFASSEYLNNRQTRNTQLRLNTILSMFNNPQYYNTELKDIWVLSTRLKITVTKYPEQPVTDPPAVSVPTPSTSSACWPSTTWGEARRVPLCWPWLERQVNIATWRGAGSSLVWKQFQNCFSNPLWEINFSVLMDLLPSWIKLLK